MKASREIIMVWEFASNVIKMDTFLKIANSQLTIIETSGRGKTEITSSREGIITSKENYLKKIQIETGKIIETEINTRI